MNLNCYLLFIILFFTKLQPNFSRCFFYMLFPLLNLSQANKWQAITSVTFFFPMFSGESKRNSNGKKRVKGNYTTMKC